MKYNNTNHKKVIMTKKYTTRRKVLTGVGPLAVAVVPLFLLFFAACSSGSGRQHRTAAATSTGQAESIAAYSTAGVQYGRPVYHLSMPGELKPYEQVTIYAKVTGFVQQLKADIGDQVQKGQLLAVLEAPEMHQRYLSDQSGRQKYYSDYLYARQAYDRLVEASATTGAVAQVELDRAKAAMQGAESAYQAASARAAGTGELQDYLKIRAPFSGVITQRHVSQGALVGASGGQPIFMMAQKNKLRLTLTVPEKHAASIHKDAKVRFTVSALPGQVFTARLSRSSTLLDPGDRSLTLEFDVDNPDNLLQGGQYAEGDLPLQRSYPTYWVPPSSVLTTQSGSFVLTLTDKTVTRVPVREGVRTDSLTEVFGELNKQSRVLLKPSEEIPEGKLPLSS